jgi:hypothetical protein
MGPRVRFLQRCRHLPRDFQGLGQRNRPLLDSLD